MTLPKDPAPTIVGPSRGPEVIDPKYTLIIGTSGSTDCLKDTTGQRFWPVTVPRGEDNDHGCDGLHDEARRDEAKEME